LRHNASLLPSSECRLLREGLGDGVEEVAAVEEEEEEKGICEGVRKEKTAVSVSTLDWGDIETWPKKGCSEAEEGEPWRRFEVVMGCDLVYDSAIAPLLGKCVGRLLDKVTTTTRSIGLLFLFLFAAVFLNVSGRGPCRVRHPLIEISTASHVRFSFLSLSLSLSLSFSPRIFFSLSLSLILTFVLFVQCVRLPPPPSLCQDNGVFVYVAPPDGRAGLPRFLEDELIRKLGLVLVLEAESPKAYAANPLHSQDATSAFLHFSELSLPYVLRVFARPTAAASTAALLGIELGGPSSSSSAVPLGHTPFSWGGASSKPQACPVGHTPFSWGAV
jgi:hypothetical protein